MRHDLLSALQASRGLILVAGPTGHGKTTVIDNVFEDSTCPTDAVFLGDIRDADVAARAVSLARSSVVVAMLRISRAAGAFARLIDMGISAAELAEVAHIAFSTRLIRPTPVDATRDALLLFERLAVTNAIRTLIVAGADPDAILQRAMIEGMRSLRQRGSDHAQAGLFAQETINCATPDD